MTQRTLLNKCFLRSGKCKDCPYAEVCNKYKMKYRCDPYEDDEVHPERYNDEELL